MEKFEGEFLVELSSNLNIKKINYRVIENITEFDKNCECIIIKNLNPDFSILLGSLKLIISECGSPLAHLAIVGREQNVPILLVDNIISKIPKKGSLSVKENAINIKL